MTMCKLQIHGLLFSLDLQQHKHLCLWLWDFTQKFQITISNDLLVETMFCQRLIVDLTPVNSCVIRRYKTSQISQRVTKKSSKSLKNVARVPFLYVKKLEWNSKRFRGLGPVIWKFCKFCSCNFQSVEQGRNCLHFSTIS